MKYIPQGYERNSPFYIVSSIIYKKTEYFCMFDNRFFEEKLLKIISWKKVNPNMEERKRSTVKGKNYDQMTIQLCDE